MRMKLVVLLVAAVIGCGNKKEGGGGGGSAGSAEKPVEVEKPMACPAGNVIQDGTCVAVVTAEKVQVVVQQQTRLDELAKFLDKIDTAAAPIEILNAFRKLDEWKKLTAAYPKLEMVDAVVGELDNAIKTLRTFKAGLGEAAVRLGDLKGELDKLMADQQVAKKIEEVRTLVSTKVRAILVPLAQQVTDTIDNALEPLLTKLEDVQAILDITCGTLRISGGGDQAKELCKQAKDAFSTGLTYLTELKAKPAKLYEDVSNEIEKQLVQLIDAEATKLLDAAQAEVNAALALPGAGSGSGSAK